MTGTEPAEAPLPIALGANRFGATIPEAESWALLDRFAEMGGRMVDTALVYADWVPTAERSSSEKTIGRWLRARGAGGLITVATKGGHPDLAHPERPRLDAASLRHDAERSNEHLGGPPDLYFLHRDDPAVPPGELLGTLEDLVAEGLLVRYGVSNWSTRRLKAAVDLQRAGVISHFVANQAGMSAALQPPGSVAWDMYFVDAPMLALHREAQLPLWAYSSQARGYFAAEGSLPEGARFLDSPTNRATRDVLSSVGARYGLSAGQAALRALTVLGFPVVPIVGCSTAARLSDASRGVTAALDPADELRLRQRIEEVLATPAPAG